MKLYLPSFLSINCLFLLIIFPVNAQLKQGNLSPIKGNIYNGEVLHIQFEKELKSNPKMILPSNFPRIIHIEDEVNMLITASAIDNSSVKVDEVFINFEPIGLISDGGGTKPILIRPSDPDNNYILHENVTYNASDVRPSSMHKLQIIVLRGEESIVFTSPHPVEIRKVDSTQNVIAYPIPFERTLYFDFSIIKNRKPVSLNIITPSGIHTVICGIMYDRGRHTLTYTIDPSIGQHLGYSLSIGSKTFEGNLVRQKKS